MADLLAIADLARILAREVRDPDPGLDLPWLEDKLFGDHDIVAFVAERDDRVIGFIAASRRVELHMRCVSLWVSDLVVSENVRGSGVGSLLLGIMMSRADPLGAQQVVLEVAAGNEHAELFYARRGGVRLSDRNLVVFDCRRPSDA